MVCQSNLKKNSTDVKVINLPDITLMPGLMDAHVHLMGNTELKGYAGIGQSSQLATIYGVKNAKNTLLAGFTTVRDVGAGSFSDVALKEAINKGGTTLNDFSNIDGEPGYFSQVLSVYGRNDMPCNRCDGTIKRIVQNQRASYYCPRCQK